MDLITITVSVSALIVVISAKEKWGTHFGTET